MAKFFRLGNEEEEIIGEEGIVVFENFFKVTGYFGLENVSEEANIVILSPGHHFGAEKPVIVTAKKDSKRTILEPKVLTFLPEGKTVNDFALIRNSNKAWFTPLVFGFGSLNLHTENRGPVTFQIFAKRSHVGRDALRRILKK